MSAVMQTQDVNTSKSQRHRSGTVDVQACRECRRRHAKCDYQLPVCSSCERYNRHCLYDKHSRTPLTRKHLTEVETRLERAETLLQHLLADPEILKVLERKDRTAPDQVVSFESASVTAEHIPSTSLPFPQTEKAGPPLENAPSPEYDFEWDEQETSWRESDVSDEVEKVLDGMGALAVDESTGGYLGATSGAALLRQIWMSGGVSKDERRQSLKRLISPDSTTLAWLRREPLLTPIMVGTLIDAYFGYYHPSFPILHEPTFRAQYDGLIARPRGGTWQVLANLVVAMGAFVCNNDDTDMTIFRGVKRFLSIGSLEAGNLSMVQAFALAANYLQKRNKPNSGYNYGGLALRLAIGLGLHKEFQGWQIAPLKLEIRRRVWWTLCVLDVGATVSYGRPLNWPQAGVDTKLPLNIREKDLLSDSSTLPAEVHEVTIYSYIRTQSEFHLRTMPIYHRLITNPSPSAEELAAMDDSIIGGWLDSLPQYFCDDGSLQMNPEYVLAHSIGKWRCRNVRIIMYRPFLIRWAGNGVCSTADNMATERCFVAAKETISSVQKFVTEHLTTRLAAWYALYFLFHASLIPVYCLRRGLQHHSVPDWRGQIQEVLKCLEAMNELNPSSVKCRNLILRICGNSLECEDGGVSFPPDVQWDSTQWGTWNKDWSFEEEMDQHTSSFLGGYNSLWSDEIRNQTLWQPLSEDPDLNLVI